MKKIIRLTEADLTRIVKRVISEQIVDHKNPANVASTTSVNKLSTTGGPKPVDLMQKGCQKGYVMDKSKKYYQKMGQGGYDKRKVYPSGKWSEYQSNPTRTEWGTWKCSGDKILFDIPGTEVGKEIYISNNDYFTDSEGGGYSVTSTGYQSMTGKIISKTPDPQYNGYRIKVKGIEGCVSTLTDYLNPTGGGSFELLGLEIEKC